MALYGPGGWAAGGALVGGTNAYLSGAQGWDIVKGTGIGAAAGLAGGAAGQWATKNLGGVVISGTNITSPVLKGAVGGAIGGAIGGYGAGFTAGMLMTGNFGDANKMGLNGAAMGGPLGGVTGGFAGYKYAKQNELNPWTGKSTLSVSSIYDLTPETGEYANNKTLYRGTTGSEGDDGALFMTDSKEYAQKYILNGGTVKEITMPSLTLDQMKFNGALIKPPGQYNLNGVTYREYMFNNSTKQLIVPHLRPSR